jgi:hypothetical protein
LPLVFLEFSWHFLLETITGHQQRGCYISGWPINGISTEGGRPQAIGKIWKSNSMWMKDLAKQKDEQGHG